jgi:hypothetical protein
MLANLIPLIMTYSHRGVSEPVRRLPAGDSITRAPFVRKARNR